jgi:CDP-diacylglycerol--glycerol-3-phosphate 3-phosphatidyltransferase
VLRLGLVPVFVVLLVRPGEAGGSPPCDFGVASLADLLDELARRRGLITDFGKIAEPIADKALTGRRWSPCRCWASCPGGPR